MELETIKWYSSKSVYKKGISEILNELDYGPNDKIHLNFDVDVLDPRYFPATGTPVPHGLQPHHIRNIVVLKDKIVAFDIVEYNPKLGNTPYCKEFIVDCIKRLHM